MKIPTTLIVTCAAVAALAAGAPRARADEVKPKTLAEYLEARQPDFARFGVRPYGWVAASATTTLTPHGDRREARVFDDFAEGVHLNQAYLALERTPDEERAFDLGGKVAGIFGTDARFLHAAGWMDDQDGDEQADLLEANLVARAAVGCGLTLKVGRFSTPLGYEVIEEPNVPLPSRGLLFGYAIPFTHVGALLAWQVDKTVKLSYGLVRGWDVGDDNNDAWSHLVGFAWTSPQGGDTVSLQAIVGAERPDDDRHLRTVVDAVWAIDLSAHVEGRVRGRRRTRRGRGARRRRDVVGRGPVPRVGPDRARHVDAPARGVPRPRRHPPRHARDLERRHVRRGLATGPVVPEPPPAPGGPLGPRVGRPVLRRRARARPALPHPGGDRHLLTRGPARGRSLRR